LTPTLHTTLCPCFQLCANDILDGVDEFIESISLLPEPEKTPHPQDIDHQPSLSHGEEDGNVTDVLGEGPHSAFQSYIAETPELTKTFLKHFQYCLFLLVAIKEDPPSSLLEEKRSDQLGLPQTLQQEFSLINVQIRNVNVEVRQSYTLSLCQSLCQSCPTQALRTLALWKNKKHT
jgi:hypothetical protein